MFRLPTFCILLSLLYLPCSETIAQQASDKAKLRSGVLMGMKLENVSEQDDGIHVLVTGAEFVLEKSGTVRCFQRIPERREVARVDLPKQALPLSMGPRTDFACLISSPAISLTIQGDSLIIIKAKEPLELSFKGLFQPAYNANKDGNWLFIDEQGGFGIYPVERQEPKPPLLSRSDWSVDYKLKSGGEIWFSVFPPRPYDLKRAYDDLVAHEGNEKPYCYPSNELIRSSAKHCKIMIVHSWLWPGGDGPPWKIPRFVPGDMKEFERVRDELHRNGMKLIPYVSPFYYSGDDYFAEARRVLEDYKADGLYFDGVSFDIRTSYDIVRKTRKMLGEDRILFRHCSQDPIKSPRMHCPFIDTYCDYIYRGEAGRAGLELDDFLRWTISGYNISNAVGYWVYTGSTGKRGYVRQAPPREHIDAAARNEVRIPRTEIGYELNLGWEPNDGHLEFFDKYYYEQLARRRGKK